LQEFLQPRTNFCGKCRIYFGIYICQRKHERYFLLFSLNYEYNIVQTIWLCFNRFKSEVTELLMSNEVQTQGFLVVSKGRKNTTVYVLIMVPVSQFTWDKYPTPVFFIVGNKALILSEFVIFQLQDLNYLASFVATQAWTLQRSCRTISASSFREWWTPAQSWSTPTQRTCWPTRWPWTSSRRTPRRQLMSELGDWFCWEWNCESKGLKGKVFNKNSVLLLDFYNII